MDNFLSGHFRTHIILAQGVRLCILSHGLMAFDLGQTDGPTK